jgi:hypothetical protein
MAGSFTSPSGSPPKSKHGRGHPSKESNRQAARPEYPITDSFASDSIPSFATRRANTNNKSGFNVIPARSPAGRLANRAETPVSRGSGKVVGRNESGRDANSRGSGGTQKK